jgi:hypothetical protein
MLLYASHFQTKIDPASDKFVDATCKLFGITDREGFETGLITKQMVLPGSKSVTIPLNQRAALDNRDTLAKVNPVDLF